MSEAGVDYCQGFYIGKPEMLRDSRDNVVYLN